MLLVAGLLVCSLATSIGWAQSSQNVLAPASTGGIAAVDRALARLSTHRRLLVIGAHPDDEDTSVLALVSRGQGGEAAYLSLSRGEGGQNLIGPELGVGLGLLRSRELLAAREIDGARQFFTRAYDFGFTRSLDETLRRWPRETLLEDALRVVRRFRPQVIVSVFPPTPQAGHGQHQAAALIAAEVFDAAANATAAPGLEAEGLGLWRPLALYRSGFFDQDTPALVAKLGGIDPLDGRSFLQLARASRSQHRSQDMGMVQDLGGGESRLIPVAGVATSAGSDPFTGIDTRLAAMAAELAPGAARARAEAALGVAETLARETRRTLSPSSLAAAAKPLEGILRALREARRAVLDSGPPDPEIAAVTALVDEKIAFAEGAWLVASGVVADTFADRSQLVPAEKVRVELRLWNGGDLAIDVSRAELAAPADWRLVRLEGPDLPAALAAGQLATWVFEAQVPATSGPSIPYFLARPQVGDLYDWSAAQVAVRGLPFEAPVLAARWAIASFGAEVDLRREVVHRRGDQAEGEIREPLLVVPAVEIAVDPGLLVWPVDQLAPREVMVELTNHRSIEISGALHVTSPAGWPAVPAQAMHVRAGGKQVVSVPLVPPSSLASGDVRFRFEAEIGGERSTLAVPVLRYAHVRPTLHPREATLLVRTGELRRPQLGRIGYVRGAADRVPEALGQIGVAVEELSPAALAAAELSRYAVIVVGSRAYETAPALAAANARLLEFVRQGGTLVVQYQQYPYVRGGFAPFALDIARPHGRVTDETAPVRILASDDPLWNRPNHIGPEDWKGWVQERGLYFAATWDPAYRPLLGLADPGAKEELGSLLVARLGEGTYVYTGLSFFRQLPAGVIGGFKLFLNLLALGDGGAA